MDRNTRMGQWRSRALHVLIVIVLIAGIRLWQQRDMVSGQAPQLQGVMLDGRAYTLPLHPAHPVMVHFWAAWCPTCRAEQGSIAAIARDYPDVITIAMQSGNPAEVAAHLQDQGVQFPVVNDPEGRIAGAWGVHAVPVSFIIAPDGKIRFVEVGYATEIGLRIRLWLAGW